MELNLNIVTVSSVYSGRDGACCCGCAGKHTYAKQHQAWASKNRGYAVTDDEVNDRTVKLICGKIVKAFADGHGGSVDGDVISTVVGKRLYVAYLKS